MPRNSQGLYTLPAGNPVVPNTLIEANWANPTMDDIAAALTGSLPRDGSAPMTGPLTLASGMPTAARHATSKAYVDQFLAYASGLPVGAVTAYAGSTVPAGYFECNGQAVSRTTYAALFAAIGTTYGAGDASTTFNVPDMRDEFIRGKSDSRPLGNKQAGSFANHTHATSDPGHGHALTDPTHVHSASQPAHTHGVTDLGHAHSQTVSGTAGSGYAYGTGSLPSANTGSAQTGISIQAGGGDSVTVSGAATGVSLANNTTGLSIGATGDGENRPQNIAQIYIIKAAQDASGPVAVTGITTSDPEMISVDNTSPVAPELVIHSNVAFGTVKLDAGGKVPLNQMPSSSQQLLGFFDASGGQNPTEKYPTQTFSNGDTYNISVGGSITAYDTTTLVSSLTAVTAGNLLQYITGSLTNPTGWYYVAQTISVVASQVGFTPAAGIAATNVQSAIVEVQGNIGDVQAMIPTTASQIGFVPEGTIAATTVQAAIAELDSETQAALAGKASVGGVVTQTGATGAANIPVGTQLQRPGSPLQGMFRFNQDLVGFEGFNGTAWTALGAANASQVAFTPVGTIIATNVQAALAELDSEKQAALGFVPLDKNGDTMTGLLALAASGVRFNDFTIQQSATLSTPLTDRGSFQLPGGVRGQYGTAVITFDASGNGTLNYNSAFPNTAHLVSALSGDAGAAQSVTFSVVSSTLSGAVLRCITVSPYAVKVGAVRVNWLALGS